MGQPSTVRHRLSGFVTNRAHLHSYRQVTSRLAVTKDGCTDTHLRRATNDSKYHNHLRSAITKYWPHGEVSKPLTICLTVSVITLSDRNFIPSLSHKFLRRQSTRPICAETDELPTCSEHWGLVTISRPPSACLSLPKRFAYSIFLTAPRHTK